MNLDIEELKIPKIEIIDLVKGDIFHFKIVKKEIAVDDFDESSSYGPFKRVNSKIIFSSKPIILKCLGNNRYLSKTPSHELNVSKIKITGVSEFFEFKYLPGGFVALVSKERNTFVSAENAGMQYCVANRAKIIGTWEVFELHDNSDGSISLKSLANGNFLSVSQTNERLIANKTSIGPWEKFKIINLFTL